MWRWDGTYFQCVQTGKVLDSNSNGNVYTNPNNGGDNQKWYQYIDNGNSKIGNKGTSRWLDSDSNANIRTSDTYQTKYPTWNFITRMLTIFSSFFISIINFL